MTLHWWMHWFWVTAQILVIVGNPLPSTTAEPRNLEDPKDETLSTDATYRTTKQQSFRIAKAIGLYPQSNTAVMLDRQQIATTSLRSVVETSTGAFASFLHGNNGSIIIDRISNGTTIPRRQTESMDRLRNVVTKKDNKITWIEAANKTNKSKYEREEKQQDAIVESTEAEELTVLPLQEENNKFRLVLNRTRLSSSSSLFSSTSGGTKTYNRSEENTAQLDEEEEEEELVESRPLATAASILEVGVSRTRSTFPKDFRRDQVQEGNNPSSDYNASSDKSDNDDATDKYVSSSRSTVDIAAITGSCLATVVLLSTMGSLGFIMYRRRYLNPPQTLNSDKCSNPDSSGYIDDSTIRDNSEEMYSLDNDSFLNSLEAMTIQNYWTDSVKHTKL